MSITPAPRYWCMMIPRPTLQTWTYNNSPPHPQDVDVCWFPPPSRCCCIMIPHPTPQMLMYDDPHHIMYDDSPPPTSQDVAVCEGCTGGPRFERVGGIWWPSFWVHGFFWDECAGDPRSECADDSGLCARVSWFWIWIWTARKSVQIIQSMCLLVCLLPLLFACLIADKAVV